MTRVSTSRPRWSVPNQCAQLGGWNFSRRLPLSGSWLVNSPGTMAHAATRTSIAPDTRADHGADVITEMDLAHTAFGWRTCWGDETSAVTRTYPTGC